MDLSGRVSTQCCQRTFLLLRAPLRDQLGKRALLAQELTDSARLRAGLDPRQDVELVLRRKLPTTGLLWNLGIGIRGRSDGLDDSLSTNAFIDFPPSALLTNFGGLQCPHLHWHSGQSGVIGLPSPESPDRRIELPTGTPPTRGQQRPPPSARSCQRPRPVDGTFDAGAVALGRPGQ